VFFSSRRRHTRFSRDWSSDVCSSDLQLSRDEGEFLFGAAPCIADFSVAHCLWFLKGTPVTAPLVDDYPEVAAWLGKVLGVGHGSQKVLDAADAVALARDSEPALLPGEDLSVPTGHQVGQQVATRCAN